LRLGDGRIVVANNGTKEIRYYSSDGSLLHATGREGEGPGEFRALSRVWLLPGDSVIAYDTRLDRISLYDATGSLVVGFQAPRADVSFQHVFPDGLMLGRGTRRYATGETSRVHRDSVPYTLYERDGNSLDTVGWFQGDEDYVFSTDRAVGRLDPPFRRQAALAVYESELYTGYGDRYEIRVWSQRGQLRRIIRRAVSDVEIGDGVDEYREGFNDAEIPAWLRAEVTNFSFPSTGPAISAFMMDVMGNLWVRRPAWPSPTPDNWDVFNPVGLFLGTVHMPERFEPHGIGGDWIIGTWTDDMDVEYVDLYALSKP
jgi:hypothetical protein